MSAVAVLAQTFYPCSPSATFMVLGLRLNRKCTMFLVLAQSSGKCIPSLQLHMGPMRVGDFAASITVLVCYTYLVNKCLVFIVRCTFFWTHITAKAIPESRRRGDA